MQAASELRDRQKASVRSMIGTQTLYVCNIIIFVGQTAKNYRNFMGSIKICLDAVLGATFWQRLNMLKACRQGGGGRSGGVQGGREGVER